MNWPLTVVLVFLGVLICAGLYLQFAMRAGARRQRVKQDVRVSRGHVGEPTTGEQISGAERAQIDALLREGKTITAIKRYRELTGAGLQEARDAIEAMSRTR